MRNPNYVHVLDVAIPAPLALRFWDRASGALIAALAGMTDYELRRWLLTLPNTFIVR